MTHMQNSAHLPLDSLHDPLIHWAAIEQGTIEPRYRKLGQRRSTPFSPKKLDLLVGSDC